MNPQRLSKLLANTEAQLTATQEQISALKAEFAAIRESSDPLARHIFQARRNYRRVCHTSTSKSGKDIKHECERSYQRAYALGFRGRGDQWMQILNTHDPDLDALKNSTY